MMATERSFDELYGWKSIAAYLGRKRGGVSVLTAQKWATEYDMPILKVGNSKSAGVMAYTDQLDEWWRTKMLRPRLVKK